MEEPKSQSKQRSRGQESQVGETMQVLYLRFCTTLFVRLSLFPAKLEQIKSEDVFLSDHM